MAAGPTSITICNRLMRKIGKEMSGEVRKNHYASTTPFYLSGDCLEPANQGIYWWPERESNLRHTDFQSVALPTELSGRFEGIDRNLRKYGRFSRKASDF